MCQVELSIGILKSSRMINDSDTASKVELQEGTLMSLFVTEYLGQVQSWRKANDQRRQGISQGTAW